MASSSPSSVHTRPLPLNSLSASAMRLTKTNINRFGRTGKEGWQDESWEMYDLVGEQRFLGSTLGNRVGQARLFVGHLPSDPTDEPDPIVRPDPEDLVPDPDTGEALAAPLSGSELAVLSAWEGFCPNPIHLAQLLTRAGTNLFAVGDGWVVGIPRARLVAASLVPGAPLPSSPSSPPAPSSPAALFPPSPTPVPVDRSAPPVPPLLAEGVSLDDLEWRFLSTDEFKPDSQSGRVTIHLDSGGDTDKIEVAPDEVFSFRVWRSHPRRWWQADSPTRSSLPILRELVGLTMHVSAQVDSRLAGAGVLLVPQSAKDAVSAATANPETSEDEDPFTEALMAAMMAAISDRSNASALVPLTLTVPDDSIEKFRHLTFATPLDSEARLLREEAIRRLALGQDCPPELLLGVGNMNHWGAWLVQEDTIVTHIEPPLALICDAITTQYLWPVLIDQGMEEDLARTFCVWYSVDHMIARPNRFNDAKAVHEVGALSDPALRREGGFSEEDAPDSSGEVDQAVTLALELVRGAPTLAQDPGIPALVEQLRQTLAAEPLPGAPAASAPPPGAEVPAGSSEATGDTTGGSPQGVPAADTPAAEPTDAPTPPGLAASLLAAPSSHFSLVPTP